MTPIWLLDVDGVVNAIRKRDRKWDEGQAFRAGHRTGDTFVVADGGLTTVIYRPVVAECIASLHLSGQVEVRWLTTWDERANERLAGVLGLPALAVEGADLHYDRQWQWWKSRAAKRACEAEPERPLIWTDDDLAYAERLNEVDWLRDRTAPSLVIAPKSSWGIADRHLSMIRRFVKEHADGISDA